MATYFTSYVTRNGTEIRVLIPGNYRTLAQAQLAVATHWEAIKADIEHQIVTNALDNVFNA